MKDAGALVTLAALKLLVGRLCALTYKQMQVPPQIVPEMHEEMLAKWAMHPLIRSSDPAISDVYSDEVLQELRLILDGVARDYAAMK
jgi:hypothetical protein